MPSACEKSDVSVPLNATDTVKQCISAIDRKVRNLEKRKGRVECIKAKHAEGQTLNIDQKVAIASYDGIIQSIEFAKELNKQFAGMSAEFEKLAKKQLRHERAERRKTEMARIRQLIQLQTLLDNMGLENVRQDFETGNNGAVKLSEEELGYLDELYKLISPTREADTCYNEQLRAAADHICSFLDGREKEVLGTTYAKLLELVNRIHDTAYFDKAPKTEEEAAEEVTDAQPETDEDVTPAAPSVDETPKETTQDSLPAPTPESAVFASSGQSAEVILPEPAQPDLATMSPALPEETQYDAMPQPAHFPHRPFQEIVSSVQGNFNFLQDSEIDAEAQIDPAVVAAHPITTDSYQAPSLLTDEYRDLTNPERHTTDPSPPSHYSDTPSYAPTYSTDAAFTESNQITFSSNTDYGLEPVPTSSDGPQPIPMPNQARPGQSLSSGPAQSFASDTQTFGAAATSEAQSFPDSGAFSSEAQGYGVAYGSEAFGPEGSQVYSSAEAQALAASQEKKFTMNPHASIFQSMYPAGSAPAMSGSAPQFPNTSVPSSSYNTDRKTFAQTTMQQQQQQQEFSGQGSGASFGSSGFNQRSGASNPGFSGQRSSGQRGGGSSRGSRGAGGMNNGFSRGGGGGGNQRGAYNGGRGGSYQNSRGNSRGGGSMYQGYPPRTDYQPDGYQAPLASGMRSGPPSRGGGGGGSGGMRSGRGGSYPRSGNAPNTTS